MPTVSVLLLDEVVEMLRNKARLVGKAPLPQLEDVVGDFGIDLVEVFQQR